MDYRPYLWLGEDADAHVQDFRAKESSLLGGRMPRTITEVDIADSYRHYKKIQADGRVAVEWAKARLRCHRYLEMFARTAPKPPRSVMRQYAHWQK